LLFEAGFKNKVAGRSQSKEAVFLFDEYTYYSSILGLEKVDDYCLKQL
jgi:hypothetical protein